MYEYPSRRIKVIMLSLTARIEVRLTAYHKGYFEFRLCKNNVPQSGTNPAIAVTQDCFNHHLLTDPVGNSRFPAREGTSTNLVKLPINVYCEACVLQWRYRAGECIYMEGDNFESRCG